MKPYAIILSVGLLSIFALNLIFAPVLSVLKTMLIVFAYCGLLCGLLSILIQLIPDKTFRPQARLFHVFRIEKGLYEQLKIKAWKDKIPELGQLANFKKDRIYRPRDPAYLQVFIAQNCKAELIHASTIVLSFLCLLFVPAPHVLTIALPMLAVNTFLHALPCMVQRYMRPRVTGLYRKQAAKHDSALVSDAEPQWQQAL